MDRASEPLEPKSMNLFVQTAQDIDNDTLKMVALLAIFTGVRVHTLCHIHRDWFSYDEGRLYLKVPNLAPCRKYGNTEECGDCNNRSGDGYSPKSDKGGGRRLKIVETWHNHHNNTVENIDLRDAVEHYFRIGDDTFGHDMIDGDGISASTANTYVKRVADEANIGFYRNSGYTENDRLGRVPDIIPHDLRATFCVQLIRNDANPFKAIEKTGHSDVESLKPYIEFAEKEFDGDFEEEFI